jgi:integrase
MAWCTDLPDYRNVVHADACNRRLARDILPKSKANTDSLQREQLQGWFQEVRRIGNPVISAYLQALLLTGARREEMAHLRWQDTDFQWRSITVRDKVDGAIPLTPYLASLLSNLPRRNEWVFSSPTAASGRLQEPRINHNKALTAAGLPDISLHGLRRSFSSLTEWIECPAGVVAQIMGHKPSATAEKHYKVRPLDLLRMWHTKIEAWMLAQAGIAFEPQQPGLRVVSAA